MNELVDLRGRRIVVAGASSGIGKETAFLLDRLGAEVILVARRGELLKETVEMMSGNASWYTADFSRTEEIGPLFSQIASERGKCGGFVYCAGIGPSIPLNLCTPEKLQDVFSVNFFGFVECLRQVTKRGRYSEGMRIVGISSAASIRGDKSRIAYSSSKAAMNAAVRCAAKELAPKGICVNTVAPSVTATDLYRSIREQSGGQGSYEEEISKRQYLGVAEPSQIASVIAFLLSPASGFITGITLPVDGGLTTS